MEKETHTAQRGLSNRHVQLIAIAGTIGTGLFLGAGNSISHTGPSIIFVYIAIGALMFILLRTIGEMLYTDPEQHSFLNFIFRHLGGKAGFFTQWSYWLVIIFMAMAELTAIGSYIQFWLPDVPVWITEPLILLLLAGLNTLNAKFFGETEFWFGMIKIVAIVGLILTAIILIFGHYPTPDNGHVSISNITDNFQMFPKGFNNFLHSFQMVMFSFAAMEFIGMTAAETKNPRPTLKKAINQIPVRIIIFYVGALLAIMAIYNWREIPADKSPFVMVFQLIGIKWAAALINFVVLTSAASALNSALFSTSRNLFSLSNMSRSKALKPFTKLSKNGIPLNALIFTTLFLLLTPVVSLVVSKDAFVLITSITTNLILIVYIITLVAYLKFRKSKAFMPDGFIVPAYKTLVPIALVGFILIFLSLFFFQDTVVAAIGSAIWIVVFGAVAYFFFDNNPEQINPSE